MGAAKRFFESMNEVIEGAIPSAQILSGEFEVI